MQTLTLLHSENFPIGRYADAPVVWLGRCVRLQAPRERLLPLVGENEDDGDDEQAGRSQGG